MDAEKNSKANAGQQLRALRKSARLSQLNLSLLTGISQRYLSCIETGKAKPSPNMLHLILCVLHPSIEQCNTIFLAMGYAPRYRSIPVDLPDPEMVHKALHHILHNQNPAPSFALNKNWDVVAINDSVRSLLKLMGLPEHLPDKPNLLDIVFGTDQFTDLLINAQDVKSIVWQRAYREAITNSVLAERLKTYAKSEDLTVLIPALPSLVLIHIKTKQGELKFFSTFTTFGIPYSITEESLRIDHFLPANEKTWQIMNQAYQNNEILNKNI